MNKINEKDSKILAKLKENSKYTVAELSSLTGIPVTTVHNRIKQMEHKGVIKNYTLELDHSIMGNNISAYVMINTSTMMPNGIKTNQEEIAKEIKALGIEKVEILTGGTDIIAKIRVKDVAELNDVVVKKIRHISGVDKTHTMVVLSEF